MSLSSSLYNVPIFAVLPFIKKSLSYSETYGVFKMIFTDVPARSSNKYFTIYGKMLMLCQTFESRCSYHYTILSLLLGLEQKIITRKDWINGNVYWSPKERKASQKKPSLGTFTKNRKSLFVESSKLSAWVADLLEEAQDNRNWLIHESIVEFSYSVSLRPIPCKVLKLDEIREKILPIITAIYVLGAIEIETNEDEKFYDPEQETEYIKLIIDWIFIDKPETHGLNILKKADSILIDRFKKNLNRKD